MVAIIAEEADGWVFLDAIASDATRLISVASVFEATIVLTARFDEDASHDLDALIKALAVDVRSVDRPQLAIAREAYRRYGKGRHPASLNFGDCFSYALAKAAGEPLLFKGNDFALTDIVSAS